MYRRRQALHVTRGSAVREHGSRSLVVTKGIIAIKSSLVVWEIVEMSITDNNSGDQKLYKYL
jgi:hypothetical protein